MATNPQFVQTLISNLREKHLPDDSGTISLSDTLLRYMNECRFPGKKTLLMRVVEFSIRDDVEFLLKIKGLEVNRRNANGDTAADISWNLKNYDILLLLLLNDSIFPKEFLLEKVATEVAIKDELKQLVEERETLHNWIMRNELSFIEDYMKNHKSAAFYGTDNVSAFSRAIQYQRLEICLHLSCISPNFRIPDMVIKERNWPQNWEKSHILKFVHATRFLDVQDREEGDAIIDMYLELDKHEEISWLMKVIQFENFELYFEMKSEFGNPEELEVHEQAFGITNTDGRIYIGGRGIITKKAYRQLYGICAQQLCHCAMIFMYDGMQWNPYYLEDKERKENLRKIHDLYNEKEDIDTVIKEIYEFYSEALWDGELIARIPTIIGMYDKEMAAQIFQAQISELHNYYLKYILPDCKEFSKLDFHSIPLRQIKELSEHHGIVRGLDKCRSPFIENFLKTNKYEDYLIPLPKCTVLPTSNPKLCAMHIFHELKRKFPIHSEKRCLAFDFESYIQNDNFCKILEAFKSKICDTLILLVTDKNTAWEEEINNLTKDVTEKKQIIIVTTTDIYKDHPQWKKLNYQWNDLSKKYQKVLMGKLIMYQGKRTSLEDVLKYCEVSQLINPDVLWRIMLDELSIGEGISSIWNERELYVERTFVRFVYKKDNFQTEQIPSHYLFMTGISELSSMMKKWSQMLFKDSDQIEEGKYIFISQNEKNNADLFRKFYSNNEKKLKQVFWIHYTNGKYQLRESLGRSEDLQKYFTEDKFNEMGMVWETHVMSEVLVADDPGTGKSTSVSSLIEKMKKSYPEKFICRVNFCEHLNEFSASSSRHSRNGFLQRVCKMNNQLENMVFQAFIGVPRRIVVFFDGFDEMSKDSQRKAMKLLQFLRNSTQIQMWILTRKHERLALEEKMNTVSFSLRQFSLEDKCKYLNQFWVRQLTSLDAEKEDLGKRFQEIVKNLEMYAAKCGDILDGMKEVVNIQKKNQEECLKKINELDFIEYSKLVISSVKENILKGKLIVPLWLWMTANIILNSNFKIPDQRGEFTFYTDFIDKKVNSYLRDECKILSQSKKQQRIYNRERRIIFENLWNFSIIVMRSKLYSDNFEKDNFEKDNLEKDDLEKDDLKTYDLKEEDLEELVDVGLLRKGKEYYFFHMTFAEFFFSQMIVKKINVKFLTHILFKESYQEVRLFLDDFLEEDKSQSFIFPKILLQKFDLFKMYSIFCKIFRGRTGFSIWKKIFQDCETHMESVDEASISKILNFYPFQGSVLFNVEIIDLLNSTLTDRMLFIIFDSLVDVSHKFIFKHLREIKPNDLTVMFSIFEKIINYKKSYIQSGISSTDVSLENIKVGLQIFERKYGDFLKTDIYHVSAKSSNLNAFIEILRFASKFVKREEISELLQRTDADMYSILHNKTIIRRGKILNDVLEIQTVIGKGELNKLLTMKSKDGKSMLHHLMKYSEDSKDAIAVLECIQRVMEGELFWQFFLQVDNRGIFPISNSNFHIMKAVLEFMGHYFNKEGIREMLTKNKEHIEESIQETDCFLEEILYLEELLGRELFCEMLHSKDKDGLTRLHKLMKHKDRGKMFVRDLKVYASFLSRDSFRDFLFSQENKYGSTFLQYWAAFHSVSQDINIWRELHFILSPDAFEQLLNIREKTFGGSIIHSCSVPLSHFWVLEEFLGKQKFIELVTAKGNKDGFTRLHFLSCFKDDYRILLDLKFYSELLDESLLRDFVLTKDKEGKTFYCYVNIRRMSSELKRILSPDLFKELQNT